MVGGGGVKVKTHTDIERVVLQSQGSRLFQERESNRVKCNSKKSIESYPPDLLKGKY